MRAAAGAGGDRHDPAAPARWGTGPAGRFAGDGSAVGQLTWRWAACIVGRSALIPYGIVSVLQIPRPAPTAMELMLARSSPAAMSPPWLEIDRAWAATAEAKCCLSSRCLSDWNLRVIAASIDAMGPTCWSPYTPSQSGGQEDRRFEAGHRRVAHRADGHGRRRTRVTRHRVTLRARGGTPRADRLGMGHRRSLRWATLGNYGRRAGPLACPASANPATDTARTGLTLEATQFSQEIGKSMQVATRSRPRGAQPYGAGN